MSGVACSIDIWSIKWADLERFGGVDLILFKSGVISLPGRFYPFSGQFTDDSGKLQKGVYKGVYKAV